MHDAVISDASCFIILSKIHALELLHETYGEITTTPEIVCEVKLQIPAWVTVRNADMSKLPFGMPASIDRGEASAIALALEIVDSILIIDERTARNFAIGLGLNVTGTLGVIVKAKLDGVIPSVCPFIAAIRNTNFRFSKSVEANAFLLANETP